MKNFVDTITQARLPTNQFMDVVVAKDQIFIHHTASSASPYGVLDWWASNEERVATAFIIGGAALPTSRWKDGEILQTFFSGRWGWHLGLKASDLIRGGRSSQDMNSKSIGIEICNWGWLTLKDGKFHTYTSTPARPSVVAEKDVVEYKTPYRGQRYYQRYTPAQIDSTYKLLRYLGQTYNIPTKYKGIEMFEIDKRPLMGESGIWTHTSVRKDKSDCHPQPELLQMLGCL